MDPIGDFINRIKTASATGLASITVPYSKIIGDIADVLVKNGFLKSAAQKGKGIVKSLEAELVYTESGPRIAGAERVSKLSRRVYQKSKDSRPVLRGRGIAVLSTPKGILTDAEARKANVGGEVLFKMW